MFESGTPRDRAEIAASEAEKAVGENRKRQLRRLCHQGRGGGEAFALAQDDVQDVGCFGRKRSETDRQQARARAERVNESTHAAGKGQFGVISGDRTCAVVVCEVCRSARDGPDKVGGRQGKEAN